MALLTLKTIMGLRQRTFTEIIKQMEHDNDLVQVVKKYFQYDQKNICHAESRFVNFFPLAKELIDAEIERFKDFNASKIKEYSHKDVPWIGSTDLHPISYEAVFTELRNFP